MQKFNNGFSDKVYYDSETKEVCKLHRYPQKYMLMREFTKVLENNFGKKYHTEFFFNKKNDTLVEKYDYFEGHHLCLSSSEEYEVVNELIITFEKFVLSEQEAIKFKKFSIFNEIDTFFREIKLNKNHFSNIEKWWEVSDSLYSNYLNIKHFFNNRKLFISHGDLHSENILISKNQEVRIIDWDEICLAPSNFDSVIFNFRYQLLKKPLDIFDVLKLLSSEKLMLLLLYIIKIIIQKIYLEKIGTINSSNIKKDPWIGWLEHYHLIILNFDLQE